MTQTVKLEFTSKRLQNGTRAFRVANIKPLIMKYKSVRKPMFIYHFSHGRKPVFTAVSLNFVIYSMEVFHLLDGTP